jgi:hypothetical protein
MPGPLPAALTDAEMAAELRLEIKEWLHARRCGRVPAPALTIQGRERWTPKQLRAMLGARPSADPAAAEAMAMEAVDRAAQKAPRLA